MSSVRNRGRLTRLIRRFWRAIALALVAFVTVSGLAIWNATHVRWAEVMAAAAKQKTINGVGRVYAEDGSEWGVALWVRVDGLDAYISNSMLVPIEGNRNTPPTPEVAMLSEATDYTNAMGAVGPLAANNVATRVHPVEWGGQPVLKAEVGFPRYVVGEQLHPDRYRFYLDPETHLVKAAELFVAGRLRATVGYHYNRPLPKGFRAE